MTMLVPCQTRTSLIALVVGLLVAGGCSDSPADPVLPDFTITAGGTNFSIPRGGSTTTFVKATRVGGFVGAISFGITGGANLTTGIGNTTAPDSARVDLGVIATAPVGTSSLQVSASSPGSPTQKLTITVAITAPAESVDR